MEIILLKDVDKVGDKHEIVSVKNGYGRNFLIPQGMAIVANISNRKQLTALIKREDAVESKKLDVYKDMASQLKGKTVRIAAKAGTSGKIFGSVTSIQLSAAIKDQLGLEVERKKIHLPDEVKELGTYEARIDLHKEVHCNLAFEVFAD